MSDFADRPLYTTPVVGLRAFSVKDDHLHGPIMQGWGSAWAPGENVAQCVRSTLVRLLDLDEPIPHDIGGMSHGCGFYAYYDGRNDHLGQGLDRVAGIIAGYGTVTAGTRGFRAGKARILALVRLGNHRAGCGCHYDEQTQAVAANYPDVPWYDTEAEALEAHPLTNPADLGIQPPDPDEPGTFTTTYGWRAYTGPRQHHIHVAYDRSAHRFAADTASAFNRTIEDVAKIMNDCTEAMQKLDELTGVIQSDPLPADLLERKRALDQQRAERRAGLRGTGGFDKRGQRR